MKFAIIDGQKIEASPGASAACSCCAAELIAKCGDLRVWHWAHKGKRSCDPWWENETEWHRAWKNQFPVDWQEVVHFSDSGEKHIADVKTEQGWVLEFQHSFLRSEERRAREAFYPKLIWIVDGVRRKRDRTQLLELLRQGSRAPGDLPLWTVHFPDECALLRDWAGSAAPVFFDFGDPEGFLWCLLPGSPAERAYVGLVTRAQLFAYHGVGVSANRDFDSLKKNFRELVTLLESRRAQSLASSGPRPPSGFQNSLAWKRARSFRRL